MFDEELESVGFELERRFAIGLEEFRVFLAEAIEEVLDEKGEIFFAVAEGRQGDVDDVEAVVKIFAEAAFVD